MPAITLDLADDRRDFRPRERLDLSLAWELSEPPRKGVTLNLFWYTSGKGTEDLQIVDSRHFDSASLNDKRRESFDLPAGPYSFSGTLITLTWVVEAFVEGDDELIARIEFVLAPGDTELTLQDGSRPEIASTLHG